MWRQRLLRMTAAATVFLCMTASVLASGTGPVVCIGIKEGQNSTSVSGTSDMILYKNGTVWKKIRAYTPVAVTYQNGALAVSGSLAESVTIEPAKNNGTAVLMVGNRPYRGDIRLIKSPGRWGMTVINEVPLEYYLYGVVGSEMSSSWAPEALKAQSVAARTYAVAHKGYFIKRGFDMTNDTSSQAYGGVLAESPAIKQAVDATRGEILTYGGRPIDALFSASGGGYTEHSENVWGSMIPYLRGVYDDSSKMPDYRWQVTTTAADMERKLRAAGKDVGTIRAIVLTPLKKRPITAADRGISGRVTSMVVIGTKGQVRVTGNSFQQIFGLKSTLFDFYQGAGVPGDIDTFRTPLRNTMFTIKNAFPIMIYGYGWGHGLGMSQWGANQMGRENISYQTILYHYYSNTKLEKLY